MIPMFWTSPAVTNPLLCVDLLQPVLFPFISSLHDHQDLFRALHLLSYISKSSIICRRANIICHLCTIQYQNKIYIVVNVVKVQTQIRYMSKYLLFQQHNVELSELFTPFTIILLWYLPTVVPTALVLRLELIGFERSNDQSPPHTSRMVSLKTMYQPVDQNGTIFCASLLCLYIDLATVSQEHQPWYANIYCP
jgi:hypothetical protein